MDRTILMLLSDGKHSDDIAQLLGILMFYE